MKMRSRAALEKILRVMAGAFVAMAISATAVQAQLSTQHIKGSSGLKSGTQPAPHWYAVAPLIYVYNTGTVRDRNGNELALPGDLDLTSTVYGGGFLRVTPRKILGANYGYQVLFPLGANNRIQGTEIDFNPGAGLTDSYVQPISLGWHVKRADAVAGYGLFVPTGRFTAGATNNTGFGMWGHELSLGTTVFLNEAKEFHAATLATFDFQSKKEDSNTKVGNVLNLEGGVGGDFLAGRLTAGLTYYASFKLTDDRIDGIPGILITGKDRVFALGPEATLALARKGKLYGFLKVNYQWQTYARTTTQGQSLFLTLSLPLAPITLPKKP